jgi:hypothetical protein
MLVGEIKNDVAEWPRCAALGGSALIRCGVSLDCTQRQKFFSANKVLGRLGLRNGRALLRRGSLHVRLAPAKFLELSLGLCRCSFRQLDS